MSNSDSVLRVFLDEGVPVSVEKVFSEAGHDVIPFREGATPGSPDPLVCAVAEANDAILVALDGDMKQSAQGRGVGSKRFRRLSLIKLSCNEPRAAERLRAAMTLIEHEWRYSSGMQEGLRRLFIEVTDSTIRTHR